MNAEDLINWISEYNVKEETEKGIWIIIENFKKVSPEKIVQIFGENFDPKLLSVIFNKVAFTLRLIEPVIQYIASYAKVEYNGEDMGVYKLIFDLNGKIIDDYWLSDAKL